MVTIHSLGFLLFNIQLETTEDCLNSESDLPNFHDGHL